MAIDYRVLLEGLSDTSDLVNDGDVRGLAAINCLLRVAVDATGAAGATYTEYSETGGRVVAAVDRMAWSLGQPIAPEYIDPAQPAAAWAGRVDLLPAEVAEPLLSRDLAGMAGHPVASSAKVFGSVHLYFTAADGDVLSEIMPILRLIANSIAHLATDNVTPPTALPPEADDRTLFLAVTGHELRTPVTVIKGYASTLADRWDSLEESSRRESALVLTQRADELARLVDRLLTASVGTPAAGWLVRTVPFNLVDALLRVASEMPGELRRTVRLELPNSLPPAYGDPTILASVLGELVTNAVRYSFSNDDGPSVEIAAGADARTVFVQVCDRGVGIDPAHVELAFERFWRAERNGDAHRSGVGLGLYLVRRLVERQNGWVSLRPRDGGGAVAEVRLPRADGLLRPSASGEA
jgi:two-component system, OmpR family, phosphate regulon sensor histidine kinase PhoR